jgi:hypothetical protein
MRLRTTNIGARITPHVANKVVDEMMAHPALPGMGKYSLP